ncbi:MAG: holo-[acyl-carrier-protein] synthase [Candidatus Dadabacteria bacterium]
MILGVGIDIVNVCRIERLLENWGDRFKKRVFSEREIYNSQRYKRSSERFAANFAVKEAFFKAIGGSLKNNIRMVDIEVLRDEYGKPYINSYGRAKYVLEMMNIYAVHVSISHDGDYATAIVVLER